MILRKYRDPTDVPDIHWITLGYAQKEGEGTGTSQIRRKI